MKIEPNPCKGQQSVHSLTQTLPVGRVLSSRQQQQNTFALNEYPWPRWNFLGCSILPPNKEDIIRMEQKLQFSKPVFRVKVIFFCQKKSGLSVDVQLVMLSGSKSWDKDRVNSGFLGLSRVWGLKMLGIIP